MSQILSRSRRLPSAPPQLLPASEEGTRRGRKQWLRAQRLRLDVCGHTKSLGGHTQAGEARGEWESEGGRTFCPACRLSPRSRPDTLPRQLPRLAPRARGAVSPCGKPRGPASTTRPSASWVLLFLPSGPCVSPPACQSPLGTLTPSLSPPICPPASRVVSRVRARSQLNQTPAWQPSFPSRRITSSLNTWPLPESAGPEETCSCYNGVFEAREGSGGA